MGGRQIPVYCEHGVCVDGGDFAETESCQQCQHSHEIVTTQQAHIEAMEKRIQAALEVYAGMEGFIPETAAEGYCLRIIEQMNKALQETDHE